MSDRLTKADWVAHGLKTLAAEGIEAIKVVPLAKSLKVSRGSFYWHFADIADFRSEMLKSWQQQATDQIIREVGMHSGAERLRQLMGRAFNGNRGLDHAVRAWARSDANVAAIVAGTDTRRIAYIAELLIARGLTEERATGRANFIYWAYLGQASVMAADHAWVEAPLLDEIASLFES